MTYRRLQRALFGAILLLSLIIPNAAAAAPAQSAEWTYVTRAPIGLRLRAEPGLTSEIVLLLFNGEDVRDEGEAVWAQGMRWTRVRVERRAGEFTGWVSSAYLANYSAETASETPTALDAEATNETMGPTYIVSAANGLRLRSGPGLSRPVKYIVPRGARLVATDQAVRSVDGLRWQQFSLDGENVWAAMEYVKPADRAIS
jgi:uncharacterized protein YgiM (DUF1202 family)